MMSFLRDRENIAEMEAKEKSMWDWVILVEAMFVHSWTEASLKVTSIVFLFLQLAINHLAVCLSSYGTNEIYIDHFFLSQEDNPTEGKENSAFIDLVLLPQDWT